VGANVYILSLHGVFGKAVLFRSGNVWLRLNNSTFLLEILKERGSFLNIIGAEKG